MNRKVTRSMVTIVLLAITSSLAMVTAQSDEQVEQFKKEKEAYYNEKLALTPAEIRDFWPIYNDFYNRKMKIVEEERNTFVYAHKNKENLTDSEITETLAKIRKLKEEQVQLENSYYKNKFPKVLPPKKVLDLYKVEWDFRHHLLRKLRGQRPSENRKGGSKQGAGTGPGGPGTPPGGGQGAEPPIPLPL